MIDPFRYLTKNVKPITRALAVHIYNITRTRASSIWIGRGWDTLASGSTEHNSGLAVDIIASANVGKLPTPNERAAAELVVAWLVANAPQMHIRHIIWDKRIYKTRYKSWSNLTNRSGVSDWHQDHIHVFFQDEGGTIPNTGLTAGAGASSETSSGNPQLGGNVDITDVIKQFKSTKPNFNPSVKIVQQALLNENCLKGSVDGYAGPITRAGYKLFQEWLGFRGADADGIPGITSLKRLASRNGFNLTD